MNLSLLIGTVGALAGVGLGSWLSARAQRGLFIENRREAMRQTQLDACITFLEAYRKLTRFVLDDADEVTLVRHPAVEGRTYPQIEDEGPLFEERDAAEARLRALVSGESPVRLAAGALAAAYFDMARARAQFGRDHVPSQILRDLRAVEDHFFSSSL